MIKKKTLSPSLLGLALESMVPGRRSDGPWVMALCRLAGHLSVGRLTLVLPDGSQRFYRGRESAEGPHGVLRLVSPKAARVLFLGGDVGFAEAYADGLWDSPDLTTLIRLAAMNDRVVDLSALGLAHLRLAKRLRHLRRANTRTGSRRNIAYHYDLGNAFYERWLDPGMTYSSALFPQDASSLSLPAAQDAKYHAMAGLLNLRPGMRVLEIGCGWGGFAEVAAREYGAEVVGVTLSQEQLRYARDRMDRQGLTGRVSLHLCDYRDVEGTFDGIASIEMFEAVGEEHWPVFFDVVRRRLAPGGRAALQVITIAEDRFERYRNRADFIQTHIFPGGMLPSPPALLRAIAEGGLEGAEQQRFGLSYARTLAQWQRAFQHAWPEIARDTGFDDRFKRMWEYYLAYCEAGFTQGTIDVGFYTADKPAG